MTLQRFLVGSALFTTLVAMATSCDPPVIKTPGAQISGTVTIDSSLSPLLPPPPGAQGQNVTEVEPNTIPPIEFSVVGELIPDDPPLIVSGSLADDGGCTNDCRDRLLFTVSRDASVTLVFEATGGAGTTNVFLVDGPVINDDNSNIIANDASNGVDPVTLSAVLSTGTQYLINLRYLSAGELQYKITLTAVSGTVVGKVVVGAYKEEDEHPALFRDPVREPKNPLGSQFADADIALDDAGNWTANFNNLSIIKVDENTRVNLFAYADNDGSASNAPANLVLNPPTRPDFVATNLVTIVLPADGEELEGVALVIDSRVIDLDFDTVVDEDRNGDGAPDDNCEAVANLGQEDGDGDGVGDACDVCPDLPDSDQANSDGVGRGDACNDSASTACPFFFTYPVDASANECFIDSDGDEIDDNQLSCKGETPFCVPPSQAGDIDDDKKIAEVTALDNCVEIENFDDLDQQSDLDADTKGDACDDDDDGDGVADADDNCPTAANPPGDGGQADEDGDGVGDACDNCLGLANPDQLDSDGDEFVGEDDVTVTFRGDACDADADGDGVCTVDFTPAADEVCEGEDNCALVANPGQVDSDGDGTGDACDTCANIDAAQTDTDNDGLGDACDTLCPTNGSGEDCEADADCDSSDDAGDGICGAAGSCLSLSPCAADADCATAGGLCLESGFCIAENDGDGDGEGDSCDTDRDNDDVVDTTDNCLDVANEEQEDEDEDGVGDACDNCNAANEDQADADEDGLGDACDLCDRVATAAVPCTRCTVNGDCGAGQVCDVDFAGHTGTQECIDDPRDDDAEDPDTTANLGACQASGAGICGGNGLCATDANHDTDSFGDACDADDDNDEVCDPCGAAAPLPVCSGLVNSADCNGADNCPVDANAADADGTQEDLDGDGLGDACDAASDDDDDEVPNNEDNCPSDENTEQEDADDDGVGDACDNCVADENPLEGEGDEAAQLDSDADGVGDACDNCVNAANPDQENADSDLIGDACDLDDDNDGFTDSDDNCPADDNANQLDTDRDGVGDACDICVNTRNVAQADEDADGVGDVCDNCPNLANTDQASNGDSDVVGDACDVCPTLDNPGQEDNEGDGIGDLCDTDDDDDGVLDAVDNCPLDANADQSDVDDDDAGDICEILAGQDADNDTLVGAADNCPVDDSTFAEASVTEATDFSNAAGSPDRIDGPAGGDLADNDRIEVSGTVGGADLLDVIEVVPVSIPGRAGLGVFVGDGLTVVLSIDGTAVGEVAGGEPFPIALDGATNSFEIAAAADATPWTLTIEVGGTLDLDADGEGDICDSCSLDANLGDRDGDGIDDACDACIVAADCALLDPDNDGICDTNAEQSPVTCDGSSDNCPDVPNADQTDSDNDGDGDACEDSDGDGLFDPEDNCPDDANADQANEDGDGFGDVCDNCVDMPNGQADADDDGVGNACDPCPVAAGADCSTADPDGDGFCTNPADGTGCPATADVCPDVSDEDQADSDGDLIGDACNDDDDPDGDEFADAELDNCPGLPNDQSDDDDDFIGDACDVDVDGDGICNDQAARDAVLNGAPEADGQLCIGIDNCPSDKNVDQADADDDNIGDLCDGAVFVPEIDEVEPNEDPAQNLGFALINQVFVVNGSAEGDDVFTVTAAADGLLTLRLGYADAASDVDIIILPGAADADFEGAQAGNPEIASVPVRAGDVVGIDINLFDGAETAYTLEVALVVDVEQADRTAPIAIGGLRLGEFVPVTHEVTGTLNEGRGDPILGDAFGATDIDVYTVEILSSGTLHLELTFGTANGLDIDAVVWSGPPAADFSTLLSADAATLANPEIADVPVVAGDVLFISLHSYAPVDEAAYQLNLSIQ